MTTSPYIVRATHIEDFGDHFRIEVIERDRFVTRFVQKKDAPNLTAARAVAEELAPLAAKSRNLLTASQDSAARRLFLAGFDALEIAECLNTLFGLVPELSEDQMRRYARRRRKAWVPAPSARRDQR